MAKLRPLVLDRHMVALLIQPGRIWVFRTQYVTAVAYCCTIQCLAALPATRLNVNLEQSRLVDGQGRGSRITVCQKTAETAKSAEKLVSISAMPVYKDKNHEELRWEDYNFNGKGSVGLISSAVQLSYPATKYYTASCPTPSISSIPLKQPAPLPPSSPFDKEFPSVSKTTTWNYPGPVSTSQPCQFSPCFNSGSGGLFSSTVQSRSLATKYYTASCPTPSISSIPLKQPAPLPPSSPFDKAFPSVSKTTTWNYPGTTSTSQPSQFSPYFNSGSGDLFSSTVQSRPLPTKYYTASCPTPSISSIPLKQPAPLSPSSPFDKAFPSESKTTTWNYPGPTSTSQPCQFSPSSTTFTPPSNLFNPFIPTVNPFVSGTALTSAASTAPLNHSLFKNPSTSLAAHTSSLNPFAVFTENPDRKPSSLNALWSTPITGPFISSGSTAANSIPVPVSSGLSSSSNQPTTLFTPSVPSAQNIDGATTTGIIGQSSVSQLPLSQITSMGKPSSATTPFGTLPPNPRVFIDGSQSKQPIQYGISSIPVKDKPAPVKHSLLTARRLSGRIKLPVQKYDPKLVATKKPFFSDTKEIPVAAYVPRENPRALVVCPEKWPPRAMKEIIHEENFSGSTYKNERDDPTKDTILDVPSKLQQLDYYTQPQISELEAKERAKPGYCKRVKEFVVGRHGYGSIKFLEETDLRNVDIETHVQFNNREVIVYMDDSKKPPVGEGLNKAAEITLLNIKCIDKKTGMQYTDGSKVNRYTEMLKKKTEAQGAEFMSYDPVEDEWKFRVQHF